MTNRYKLLSLLGLVLVAAIAIAADPTSFEHGILAGGASNAPTYALQVNTNAGLAALTVASAGGAVAVNYAMGFNGALTLGDGGDAFSVASTGIDISAAGAISNATSIAMNGTITGATDITMNGALSGATTIGASGIITTTGGNFTAGAVATANPNVANRASFGNNGFVVEGATVADANDFTFAVADQTSVNGINVAADGTATFTDGITMTTGIATATAGYFQSGAAMPASIAGDAAAFGSRGFMVEGTDDAIEFFFTVADPAVADNTIDIAANGLVTLSDGLTCTTGNLTMAAGGITIDNGTLTVGDLDGYNGVGGEMIVGVPTMRFDVVAGTASAEDFLADTAEVIWVAGGAQPPAPIALDPAVYKVGANSMSATFIADTDVGTSTLTSPAFGASNATGEDWMYFWMRCTKTTLANSLTLTLNDPTAQTPVPVPAITVANQWQLIRCPIDDVTIPAANKDAYVNIILTSNHATDLDGATIWIDQFYELDEAESTALGFNAVIQPGGTRCAFEFAEDAGDGAFTAIVEHTDFLMDYDNDRIFFLGGGSAGTNVLLLYASAD